MRQTTPIMYVHQDVKCDSRAQNCVSPLICLLLRTIVYCQHMTTNFKCFGKTLQETYFYHKHPDWIVAIGPQLDNRQVDFQLPVGARMVLPIPLLIESLGH